MTIVKICKIHGELTELQVLREKNSTSKQGFTLRCHQCRLEKDRRWKESNRETHRASACTARNEARKNYLEGIITEEPKANSWARKDRKENPEKYRKYEANYIAKHGKEKLTIMEITRRRGITVEQYNAMLLEQENKCKICNKEETRKNRNGEIGRLSIDHCHNSDKVRGLLCHNCNTGIGKFCDDIELIQNAISYLERHKHID